MAIINTYPAKTTPVGADIVNVWDSASSAVKTVTITNLATALNGLIALSGDVTGTPSATAIAAGVIVNADISASAAIALSKLATDPLARANHTGTQVLATISDAGTMASQNANAVAITGGALAGLAGVQAVATTGGWGFAGDSDTYWGYSATDTLAAVAGGNAYVTINSAGKISMTPTGDAMVVQSASVGYAGNIFQIKRSDGTSAGVWNFNNNSGGSSWYNFIALLAGGSNDVTLSSDSGGRLSYTVSGSERWRLYTAGSTDLLWVRNVSNSRMHAVYIAGATADTALTHNYARFAVGDNNLGTFSVTGSSSSAIAQVIRLASGATAHALTIEDNSGTDLVSFRSDGRIRWESSDSAPSDTTTPDAWITVYVGATAYRMPLYTP